MSYLLIIIGLAALYSGGELLVKAAVSIGNRIGLSSFVIGLTIVAFGTSAPELAVSMDAALVGSAEIAIANIVGSNFANITLVLALSALLTPIAIERLALRRDIPVMFCGFMAMTGMLVDHKLGWVDGALLLTALVVYLFMVIHNAHGNRHNVEVEDIGTMSVPIMLVSLIVGVALLSTGGHWLVAGAIDLAAEFGVSEAVIGVTIVAIGTSLPEIAASVISVVRGHSGMAVGNVVGSNIWNTFGVLGLTSTILPLQQGNVSYTMIGVMILSGIGLWLFCRTRYQLSRLEGGAMLVGFVGFQIWLLL